MDAVQTLRLAWFGTTSIYSLAVDWVPLVLAAVAPLLCIPYVVCFGTGGEETSDVEALPNGKLRFGERVALRRVMLAVRADVRMLADNHQRRVRAAVAVAEQVPAVASVEAPAMEAPSFNANSGKKDVERSKNIAEEAKIKQKAAKGSKGGKSPPKP